MPFFKTVRKTFVNPTKRFFLGRRKGTRRLDRVAKNMADFTAIKVKEEALKLKRMTKLPKKQKLTVKPSLAVAKSGFLINPYQSCRSKAVRTWSVNPIGNTIPSDYADGSANTDLTGTVTFSQCGLNVWYLRSTKAPEYIYMGINCPRADIRYIEDTATLTALGALYQYLKILNFVLEVSFDAGNVKNDVREGGLVESGTFEHFTFPSTKGEIVNISTAAGIMNDSGWEFVSESGIKKHKTKSYYRLMWKPQLQLDPKTIVGSGATIPMIIPNRSLSMDDVIAGNIPRMASPAVVFKLRLPNSSTAKLDIQIRLTCYYKNGGRIAHGFEPTIPY